MMRIRFSCMAVAVAVLMSGVVIWALGQRDAAQKAEKAANAAQIEARQNAERAEKNEAEAKRNAETAKKNEIEAAQARDEQKTQAQIYQGNLEVLSKRIEKASLVELTRIQREIKLKAEVSPLTPRSGIGGQVPPPP